MKIAIVINKSWNIYNFRLGLVQAFLREGHQVVAIAPRDKYSELLEREGCEFVALNMDEKGSNPFNDLLLVYQLYAVYKKVSPDAVLQYTIKPNIYGTLASKLLGIPCVNNVSGLGTVFLHNNYTSKIAQALYQFAFKYPKKVFFQNQDDLQLFLEKNLIKKSITDVLPGSGVNLKKYSPLPFSRNDTFTFLVIARLLFDKGIVEFVNAAKLLKQKGLKCRFQLLGFTDFNTKLGIPKQMLDSWIEEGVVDYLGTTDDVRKYIHQADCVVLPSYREGTPRTLLEAAALAKPLITTDVPGCREVVINEYNGFLCQVKNSEDLASKMEKMAGLSDRQLLELGNKSRKRVEDSFNEEIVFSKYFETLGIPFKS